MDKIPHPKSNYPVGNQEDVSFEGGQPIGPPKEQKPRELAPAPSVPGNQSLSLLQKLPAHKAFKLFKPKKLEQIAQALIKEDQDEFSTQMKQPKALETGVEGFVDHTQELAETGDAKKLAQVNAFRIKMQDGLSRVYATGDWEQLQKGGKNDGGFFSGVWNAGFGLYAGYFKQRKDSKSLSEVDKKKAQLSEQIEDLEQDLKELELEKEILEEFLNEYGSGEGDSFADIEGRLTEINKQLDSKKNEFIELMVKAGLIDEKQAQASTKSWISTAALMAASCKAGSTSIKAALRYDEDFANFAGDAAKTASKSLIGSAAAIGAPLGLYGAYKGFSDASSQAGLADVAGGLRKHFTEFDPDVELVTFLKLVENSQHATERKIGGGFALAKAVRGLAAVGMITGILPALGETIGVDSSITQAVVTPLLWTVGGVVAGSSLGLKYYQYRQGCTKQESLDNWKKVFWQTQVKPENRSQAEYTQAIDKLKNAEEYAHLNAEELNKVLENKCIRKLMTLKPDFAINMIIEKLLSKDVAESQRTQYMLSCLGFAENEIQDMFLMDKKDLAGVIRNRFNLF